MKRYTQSTLVRIVSFGFGLWLLIALITNKPARFTKNQLELILGAFIAVGVFFIFLMVSVSQNQDEKQKGHLQRKYQLIFHVFFTLNWQFSVMYDVWNVIQRRMISNFTNSMKKLEVEQMEDLTGANKCEFFTWGLMGLGVTLCTSVVAAPLGIVIGGVGAASYFAGGCG